MIPHDVYTFRLTTDGDTGEPIVLFFVNYKKCIQTHRRELKNLSEEEFKEWNEDIYKKNKDAAAYFSTWYWCYNFMDLNNKEQYKNFLKEYYDVDVSLK